MGQIQQKVAKYGILRTYLGKLNMVKWSIPEKVLKMQARRGDQDSPVKRYDQLSFLPDFLISITV